MIRASLLLLVVAGLAVAQEPPPLARSTPGLRARIEGLVLPGTLLAPRPLTRDDVVIVRVIASTPAGEGFRYDLEVHALVPGRHDLRERLVRADGSALGELPPIPFEVTAIAPPGSTKPAELEGGAPPSLGGYQRLLGLLAAAWTVGLLALLLAGRRGKKDDGAAAPPPLPPGVRELLAPLVREALDAKLDARGHARLESLILAALRERLGLHGLTAKDAMTKVRQDPDAGPIVAALESWLHAPPERRAAPDLEKFLAPYGGAP